MGITIFASRSASAQFTDNLSCTIPANTSTDIVVAFVQATYDPGGDTPAVSSDMSTKEAEALNGDQVTATLFTESGGISGTRAFTINKVADYIRIQMLTLRSVDLADIINGSPNTQNASGLSHQIGSLNAGSVVNTLLLCFFAGKLSGTPSSTPAEFGDVSGMGLVFKQESTTPDKHLGRGDYETRSSSGSTGTRTSISNFSTLSAMIGVLFNPATKPTAPQLLVLNGGETKTIGTTVQLSWNPATDPDTAQSSLQYNIDYSTNGVNGPWTQIVALTSAGATTHNWDTTGKPAGTNNYIRIRTWDGTNFSNEYDVSASAFTLVADVAPSAPTNLTPSTGSVDRAVDQTFSYQFNDTGDVQSERTFKWGTDGTNFPNTTTVATSSTSFVITGGTGILSTRGQKYWKMSVEDFAGQASPDSAVASFFAGDKPAAPNITSPTNASPPTTATPTIAFTSGGHVAFKIRVVLSGAEVFNQIFSTTGTSQVISYSFGNGLTYTLFVSVKNADGLWSNEDSETFLVTYTPPAVPGITATPFDSTGTIQIDYTNADGDHVIIYRHKTSEPKTTAIAISPSLPLNNSFIDFNIESGQSYSYYAVVIASNGLWNESLEVTSSAVLSKMSLHVVTKESTNSNSSMQILLDNIDGTNRLDHQFTRQNDRSYGKLKPGTVYGQIERLTLSAICRITSATLLENLQLLHEANTIVCLRDQSTDLKPGNIVFGKIANIPNSRVIDFVDVDISVTKSSYTEAV